MKKIIQVCFTLKNELLDNGTLKTKMEELKKRLIETYGADNFEVRSCYLTREICIQKDFPTTVPDMFKEIFGDAYVCEITESTYDAAMANITAHRMSLSRKADKFVIIEADPVSNVSLELELFTDGRVVIL